MTDGGRDSSDRDALGPSWTSRVKAEPDLLRSALRTRDGMLVAPSLVIPFDVMPMLTRKLIVAGALLTGTASAEAGWFAELPESASVALVFIALAIAAFAILPRRESSGES